MSINDRISLLISELGLNNNAFAKSLNVSPTVTFNIISGRNTKPSYELLEKIVFTYDNINVEWLIRGRGDLFTTKSNKNTVSKPTLQTKEITQANTVSYKNIEADSDMIKFLQQQVNDMVILNKDLTKIILNLSDRQQEQNFCEKNSL